MRGPFLWCFTSEFVHGVYRTECERNQIHDYRHMPGGYTPCFKKKNASLKLSLGAKSHKELRCHYASLTVVSRMMKQSFCLTDTIPLQADVSRSQSSNLSRGNFIDSYICIFPTVVANIPSDSRDVYEKVLTI